MKSRIISVNDYKFHYLEYGNFYRPVLLFIHGFHSCASQMSYLSDFISPYFNLIVPDLPGFDKSDEYQNGFNLIKSAETLLSFLKAKKIKKYFLSGFSMGGGVALEMLLNNPKGCLGTLLIYPLAMGTHMKFSPKKKMMIKSLVALAKSPITKPILRKMFYSDRIMYFLFQKLSASGQSTDDDLKRRIANSRCCSFNTYINGISSIFNFQPSKEKKFPGLKTVLILNKFDELIDPKFTLNNYRKYFPNLTLKYLDLGSHNPTGKENSSAFNLLFPLLLKEIVRELRV